MAEGTRTTRRAFVSESSQLIVLRIESSRPEALGFRVQLSSLLQHECSVEVGSLTLVGNAPGHVETRSRKSDPSTSDTEGGAGLPFIVRVQVMVEGGECVPREQCLEVLGASRVTLLVAARTGFNGPFAATLPAREVRSLVERDLARASAKTYSALLEEHLECYQQTARRVKLNLGSSERAELPTDERLANFQTEQDPAFIGLLFQYARYLLQSSSTAHTLPANRQGLWNVDTHPWCGSGYALSGPLQMNYWLAEVANLAESHVALLRFVRSLQHSGTTTSRLSYAARGWVAHHQTDLWCLTSQSGQGQADPADACWPMASAWLGVHLWEHYAFGGDGEYLKDFAYPTIKEATSFALDWLIETHRQELVTIPSVSPSRHFSASSTEKGTLSAASTLDMALLWELFGICIEASQRLDCDAAFRATLEDARSRLLSPRVGRFGQIQEWSNDWDERADTSAHVSALFGLYPGTRITRHGTPALFEAARRTLDLQEDAGMTPDAVWRLACWARLGNGNQVLRSLQNMLQPAAGPSALCPNLLPSDPSFQLHCLTGVAAAVAELLLQSHTGVLELLPALPEAWRSGSVHGLRARGGFEVDVTWAEGQLAGATIVSKLGNPIRLHASTAFRVERGGECVATHASRLGDQRFETRRGDVFKVLPEA